MNPLVPLLVWRYIKNAHEHASITTMIKICFGGIMISSCALVLILSIMSGIEKVTHDKLQTIHAQITIRAYGDELNAPHILAVLQKEFPAVAAASPTSLKQAIIQSAESDDITNVITIKAIDPHRENTITPLEKKIIQSLHHDTALSALVHDNHILIGCELAKQLNVQAGSPVSLLFTAENNAYGRTVRFSQQEAIISGLFATGIDEFDTTLMICSLEFLNTLWPETGVTQININLYPGSNETATITALRDRLNIEVFSWKDLYPGLVSALKVEKYAMFFILLLIILVACTNIISVAFMHIQQKRADIAILKSMGMSTQTLRSIFICISTAVTACGALCGMALAALIGFLLKKYPLISLPDAYYMSHLPINMKWIFFMSVFIGVIVISVIATLIPVRKIKSITIAYILRSEV